MRPRFAIALGLLFLLLVSSVLVAWNVASKAAATHKSKPVLAVTATDAGPARAMVIDVGKHGALTAGGVELTGPELLTRLEALVAANKDQQVILRPAAGTTREILVQALAVLEAAGVWNISLTKVPAERD